MVKNHTRSNEMNRDSLLAKLESLKAEKAANEAMDIKTSWGGTDWDKADRQGAERIRIGDAIRAIKDQLETPDEKAARERRAARQERRAERHDRRMRKADDDGGVAGWSHYEDDDE